MNFNLNGEEFKSQSRVIFNNGKAGKVENVKISVEKRRPDEMESLPDYKVFFTDENDAQINLGIYYPNEQTTESQTKITVSKALAVARSVVGEDYIFPEVTSVKEAIDVCMKIVNQNTDKRVNVFATFGTTGYPKKYLGVYKNYDFIEAFGTNPSKLRATMNPNKPQYNDLLEPIMEDFSNTQESNDSFDSEETKKQDLPW